ncbi:MAG: hypothetical protein IJO13_11545 [Lachnospiraceae bacterium]|nr:hypothetical protein [Lachnospiraceae bacterium]
MKKTIKRYISFGILFIAAVTISACSSLQSSVPETYTEETDAEEIIIKEIIPEENNVQNYIHTEESVYMMEIEGNVYDVTKYVISSENGECTFNSDILETVFGFEKTEESDTFVTFERDDDRVQFEINGSFILVNSQTFPSSSVCRMDPDTGILEVPLDFVFGIGYDRFNTSRNGNELYFTIGDPDPEASYVIAEPAASEDSMSTESTSEVTEIEESKNEDTE